MCHVLLIEDDFFIADFVESIVRRAGGSSVTVVATETDAVYAAGRRLPAIILSDVRLASGTGPNAVATIVERYGELPVIFITGTPEECQPCASPAVVLSKPVSEPQLMQAFCRLAPL